MSSTPSHKSPEARAELRRAALEYHEFPTPGKVAIHATKQLVNQHDLALAYSPGVAEPCKEIAADNENISFHPPDMPEIETLSTPPRVTCRAPPVKPPLTIRRPLAYNGCCVPRKVSSIYANPSKPVSKFPL